MANARIELTTFALLVRRSNQLSQSADMHQISKLSYKYLCQYFAPTSHSVFGRSVSTLYSYTRHSQCTFVTYVTAFYYITFRLRLGMRQQRNVFQTAGMCWSSLQTVTERVSATPKNRRPVPFVSVAIRLRKDYTHCSKVEGAQGS